MLTVCVCTHNPQPQLFARVMEAVAAQTVHDFEVLIVDNASSPPLREDALAPLRAAGLRARIVQEPTPGLVHARLRGIAEMRGDWMLCVDDDNVLAPDYVAEGLAFIAENPDVGAFGGKLILPDDTVPPGWTRPFLPFLAVRDVGDAAMKGVSVRWEIWEPPAAGAFVSREMLQDFAEFVRANPNAQRLGRSPGSAASCEDSLLMHSAYRLGRATAYTPRLKLTHHISADRFRFARLVALMEGYGSSQVMLDSLLRGPLTTPKYYRTPAYVAATFAAAIVRNFLPSPAFAYARVRYHMAAMRAYRELLAPSDPGALKR